MIKIYKLIKPSEPMTVYIGKTKQTLEKRFYCHKYDSKYKDRKVYEWFDNTVKIELIENYIGDTPSIREMEIVQEYISKGHIVMNMYIGKHLLNPVCYIKDYYENNRDNYLQYLKDYYQKNKELIKQKQKKFNGCRNEYQKTSEVAKKYRSEYYKKKRLELKEKNNNEKKDEN